MLSSLQETKIMEANTSPQPTSLAPGTIETRPGEEQNMDSSFTESTAFVARYERPTRFSYFYEQNHQHPEKNCHISSSGPLINSQTLEYNSNARSANANLTGGATALSDQRWCNSSQVEKTGGYSDFTTASNRQQHPENIPIDLYESSTSQSSYPYGSSRGLHSHHQQQVSQSEYNPCGGYLDQTSQQQQQRIHVHQQSAIEEATHSCNYYNQYTSYYDQHQHQQENIQERFICYQNQQHYNYQQHLPHQQHHQHQHQQQQHLDCLQQYNEHYIYSSSNLYESESASYVHNEFHNNHQDKCQAATTDLLERTYYTNDSGQVENSKSSKWLQPNFSICSELQSVTDFSSSNLIQSKREEVNIERNNQQWTSTSQQSAIELPQQSEQTPQIKFSKNKSVREITSKTNINLNANLNSKNNQCEVCGRNYARPSTLKTHLRTHTNERPFKCNVCFKTFSQAANLTAHQRVHTGERPFSCPICGRRFSQSSSVITHLRTHSGERPYRCTMCSRTFSDSSTLTKHCRIHSGEKPYQCNHCPLNFSQSGNLSRHLKLHLLSSAGSSASSSSSSTSLALGYNNNVLSNKTYALSGDASSNSSLSQTKRSSQRYQYK